MVGVTEKTWAEAILVVASIRSALINGTRHYSPDGVLMTKEKEIMECLVSQKEMRLDNSNWFPVTSEEEQIELAQREFESRKGCYVK